MQTLQLASLVFLQNIKAGVLMLFECFHCMGYKEELHWWRLLSLNTVN